MVEIMVAIGIIAILLAIAIPAMTAMIRSKKVEATKATMKTLETAIEMFARDDPLRSGASIPCGSKFTSSRTLFGPYPPTPSARFAFPPATGCDPTLPPPDGDAENASRMGSIFLGFFANELQPSPFNVGKHATIESLVFFLRRFNTGSRDLIDKLPDSVRKNLDASGETLMISDTPVELFEIVDAWGVPLVYNVNLGVIENSKGQATALNHHWELRSAGEDGKFETQFSDREGSDDVVLRGTVLTTAP